MSATNKLTETAIRNAKPGMKPIRMFDGGGLYVEVSTSGAKLWRWKYRFDGKEKRLGFGQYPEVGLKDARDRRAEARKLHASGVDPGVARRAERASRIDAQAGSFEAVAREWIETVHKAKVSAGHSARTLIRFEQDVFPWVGSVPISELSGPRLLEVIRRVEKRGAIETAHRVKDACGQVFRYGVASGRCERDPTPDIRDALRPVHVRHMPAFTDPKRVRDLLRCIDAYPGFPVTRAALALAPLVFQRPGNLRTMEWSELNLDEALWTIPAAKMKRSKGDKVNGQPHDVPLSTQAVAILRDLKPLTGHGRYVFPSVRGGDRPMSDMTLNGALQRMGFDTGTEMTTHGFRAMARTLLAERLGVPEQVIEAQLAHVVKDPLGRAYNRTKFSDQRRELMQVWADYLAGLKMGADVVPIRAA